MSIAWRDQNEPTMKSEAAASAITADPERGGDHEPAAALHRAADYPGGMTALTDELAIGPVRLPNRVVLAPLAGIGNWFVRLQARRYGAGSWSRRWSRASRSTTATRGPAASCCGSTRASTRAAPSRSSCSAPIRR